MAIAPDKTSAKGLIDFLPLPGLLVDGERELIGANSEAKSLFRNLRVGEDLALSTRNQEILEAISELGEGGDLVERDLVLSTPSERNYHLTGRALIREEGTELYLLILTDITERRDAEKIRSAFIANVSHELRSPLSTLIGAVETLKTSARDDIKSRDRFLAMMEEEAWRMKRLVDDLLSLSKLEAQEHLHPEGRVRVSKLLEQVNKTMEGRLGERDMKIVTKIPKNLPEIRGDGDELQEVLDNLIDNAAKYGRRSTKITVSAEAFAAVKGIDGPAVALYVHNQGEPIPQEQIPRLTERFYRVDKSRSRALGGTGLGLAIVKHIINHHRGKLKIESDRKKGTKFSIFLPAH